MREMVTEAEAFARRVHDGQRRKGAAAEPYADHLAEVAGFASRHGGDATALAVAWLHDTVEDCDSVTDADLRARFGAAVADAVAELTDDKSLPQTRRKALQIAHAPRLSDRAALVKLGDKWSNIRALGRSPPEGWDLARRLDYLDWAVAVVAALPALPAAARAEFDRTAAATSAALLRRGG